MPAYDRVRRIDLMVVVRAAITSFFQTSLSVPRPSRRPAPSLGVAAGAQEDSGQHRHPQQVDADRSALIHPFHGVGLFAPMSPPCLAVNPPATSIVTSDATENLRNRLPNAAAPNPIAP